MTTHKKQQKESLALEPFAVAAFRSEDAGEMVKLVCAVYGGHYPIKLFYNPDEIIAANRDGRYYSVVARTDAGKVVGVSNLYRSAPYQGLYENGVSLVLKEYRNTGAFKECLFYLYEDFIPRMPHIEEAWGEAVCNHVIAQKMIFPCRFIDTAIEVALMPAEAYSREKSARGRVAAVAAFRCYVSKPHRVYLPQVYTRELQRIYSRLDDTRQLDVGRGIWPVGKTTKATFAAFEFAQVARINVPESGADFIDRLSELEEEGRKARAIVFQVIVNLTEPWTNGAVEILRERGYFFGGLLPRWFGGDGLLMQKLYCDPNFEEVVLVQESSAVLLASIREDWARVTGKQ